MRHLFDYIDMSDTWSPRIEEMTDHFMGLVMQNLGMDSFDIQHRLKQSEYGPMIYGFLMEMMAVTSWDAERVTPIDEYMKKRGWREGTHGRRYLSALNVSELHFLEVTAVESGKWVEVRPYGTDVTSERVVERNGSESLHVYDAIVARLVRLGNSRKFGAILPLSHAGALHLKDHLDDVESDLKELYEEAVAEDGPDGLVKDFADGVDDERQTRIEETGFMCFVSDALAVASPATPELSNTDNERIAITTTRFPIVGDPLQVGELLMSTESLIDDSETRWSWLDSDGSNKVLGTLEIKAKDLLLETNSVERSQRGIALLQSLLTSDLIGTPLSVHENVEHTLSRAPTPSPAESVDMAQHPELQEAVQAAVKASYLKSLDQPIPMLGDESPRACAADPDKRQRAVDWVKYLENMESRNSATPHDFSWLWEELGLGDHR